jgi:preprotein translocase subunit YajC
METLSMRSLLALSVMLMSTAASAQSAGQEGSGLMGLLPLILLFVVFYFLLIRPQQKRAKEHRELVSALKKGDEVTTYGGILGRIVDLDDSLVELEIAKDVVVKVQRANVSGLMPKGTLKGTGE